MPVVSTTVMREHRGDVEWLDTPELDYRLVMYDTGGVSEQEIILSREEYVAVKGRLAEMRGIAPSGEPEAPEEEKPSEDELQEKIEYLRAFDEECFAANLNLARAVWRRCRKWVEAERIPDRFKSAFLRSGYTEGGIIIDGEELLKADYEKRLRRRAVELLQRRAGKGERIKK
jgi:hypothetical protein